MYIISPITVFDEDKELFETHVALNNEAKTLLLSAWGKTEVESRMCATGTIARLNFAVNHLCELPESIRAYPLTQEECYQIKGEGAESTEEL